jgi:hypothetical protein
MLMHLGVVTTSPARLNTSMNDVIAPRSGFDLDGLSHGVSKRHEGTANRESVNLGRVLASGGCRDSFYAANVLCLCGGLNRRRPSAAGACTTSAHHGSMNGTQSELNGIDSIVSTNG